MRSEYETIESAQYYDLNFSELTQKIRIDHPTIYRDAVKLPPSDVVIICVKTTENKNIKDLLQGCLAPHSIVFVIQNGIGNEEWIAQFIGACPLVAGISTMGAYRETPLAITVPFIGTLKLAPFRERDSRAVVVLKKLFDKLQPEIPVELCSNHREMRWLKLLWNASFSPMAVIYHQDSATLASQQPYATIARNVIGEIAEIAQAEGFTISKDYIERLLVLTRKNKDYYPSMYLDYLAGKKIEQEYIIDNALAIAQAQGIKTPILKLMAEHLAKLE
jgi:2-dehydropantoate 2-reductase